MRNQLKQPEQQFQLITPICRRDSWCRALILVGIALNWLGAAPSARSTCEQGCDSNYYNSFLGEFALYQDTGSDNTAVGAYALTYGCIGSFNTAVGFEALYMNQLGEYNTALGSLALDSNTSGYDNTATGYGALFSNADGYDNTAIGAFALYYNTASNNTATGDGALDHNTSGQNNTATGVQALFGTLEGSTGSNNTATGYESLFSYTSGNYNTAAGVQSLYKDTSGGSNTATGYVALYFNSTGNFNTATGRGALYKNTASNNTAMGYQSLNLNTGGHDSAAFGMRSLQNNTTGYSNTALGPYALQTNTTGYSNIAVGTLAGYNLTTGSNNIDIGNQGTAGESGIIRIGTAGTHTNTLIAGIYNVPVSGLSVVVGSGGQLGTSTSSARYKDDIKPMDKASEAILALQPVTFRYKHELDRTGIPQFGLVAEQVEKVNPDLVTRDDKGKPYSVRYEAVNAMLLNEFLKAHRKGEQQEATIAELQEGMEVLTARLKEQEAQLQKVSAQIELRKPAPQTVLNNR